MSTRMSQLLRKVLLFGQGMDQRDKAAAIANLIAGLRPFFETRGFKYEKTHQAFVKQTNALSWSFGLGLFVHPDAFTITPVGSVRHEQVEQIFWRVALSPDAFQRDSATVLWSWALEKHTPKPHCFTVDRTSKVSLGVSFVERFFTSWAEPFFREHCDLAAISNSYNDGRNILRAKFITDPFEMLAKALIAAKSLFEKCLTTYLRELT